MTKNILFSLALLVCGFATNVFAQVKIKPITVQTQAKLPTTRDLSKVFNRAKINIAPLNNADKLELINDSLKEKNLPKVQSLTTSIKFTAANPKINDDNFIAYFKPYNVLVSEDSVQFSEAKGWSDSSLFVNFKPSAAGYYLFDLSVKRYSAMNFTLFTFDGKTNITQNYAFSPDNYGHITFVVNLPEAKPQGVFIFADKDWQLFDCEISQIK